MSYVPAKVSTQYIFYASLVSQANTKIMQVNPTIAAGDFKVSIDGGALANLGTLPTVTPAGGVMVKFTLSIAEMAGANATVVCSDVAGSEWCDLVINIPTAARQIDDLAYPATSGRSMVVDANGLVDANTVKIGPTGSGTAQTAKDVGGAVPAAAAGASGGLLISGSNAGTTTLAALTVTGATTHTGNVVFSDGITVSAPSTGNRAGITVTGNGTGAGLSVTSGNGATGNAIDAIAASTNGHGVSTLGNGTGSGLKLASVSGDALLTSVSTSGHGATFAGTGTTKHGINATGGTVTSHGINAVGGGVGHGAYLKSGGGATGDGLRVESVATNGNGANAIAIGTGNGILTTGGAGAGGDGVEAVAGGGVPIRGNITGNITGTIDTVTTLTNLPAITANWLTAAGTAADFGTEVASAVWDMDATGHQTQGTFGQAIGDPAADTNTIYKAVVTDATGATVGVDCAAVLDDTGTSGVVSVTGNVAGNVTGTIGGLTAAALKDFFDTDTTTTYAGAVAGSVVKEIADNAGGSSLTVADIADGVWDEAIAGHLAGGSTGAALNGATAPTAAAVATAVWQDTTAGDFTVAASVGKSVMNGVALGTGLTVARCTLTDTLTTYTGNTVQTGDAFARIGLAGAGLTNIDLPDQTMNITGNITGNLSGSVGSVTGAVGSVTGAVGSVTGNVGGNVVGSVASVTGNVTGSIGSLAAQAKTDVKDQAVAALSTDTYAEPGQGTPAATSSLATKLGYLFKAWRNKHTQTATDYALYNDDTITVDQKASFSDDGTTATRGEISTGP